MSVFRPLRPNNRGIVVPVSQSIKSGSATVPYTRPTTALQNVDRLLAGETPRICVMRRQGGAGDVLMTLPTVRAIARKYGTKIDYGTDFSYLDGALPKIIQGNDYIGKIVPWTEMDVDDYDAVIDFTCPCVAHEIPLAPPINRIDRFQAGKRAAPASSGSLSALVR